MTRRPRLALAAISLALALPLVFAALDAHARPGGGESYGGGGGGGGGMGGGGGGGGSGGDGAFSALLLFIFSELPWPLKLLIIGGVVAVYLVNRARTSRMQDWTSGAGGTWAVRRPSLTPSALQARNPGSAVSARRRLEDLRRFDPDFSVALFEDFLYALYTHVQYATAGRAERLSAYLAPDVLARLRAMHVAEVHTVIVGALRFTGVRGMDGEGGQVEVDVEIESNVATVGAPGQPERTSYRKERWTLARRKDARSRPPARARILACPGCGAPLDAVVEGTCTHCKRAVSGGDFDWVVRAAELVESEDRGPMLTTEVPEQGNDLPTMFDPDVQARYAALSRKDPYFQWPAFEARVGLVFQEFQTAWAQRDLLKMRPYFTDALFDTQRYWVEAYRAQGLRNVTDRARIQGLELARVASDRWFDALTLRVRATGLDYVVRDQDQKVVRGSTGRERAYTEYWTFLRGAARTAPTHTAPECPSCGAPLAVGMAGDCRYCRATVTTGEFDWVLSRIEQDDAYRG
jgi:predicted lipid-binding transport protein (Tim44 family)